MLTRHTTSLCMRSLQVRCVSKITRVRNICQGPCFMSHPVYVKEEITKFCKMPCRLPSDSSSGLPPKSRRNSPSREGDSKVKRKMRHTSGQFYSKICINLQMLATMTVYSQHKRVILSCKFDCMCCKRDKKVQVWLKNAMFASTSPNAGDNIGWLTGVNVWWSTLCTFPNHTRTAKNITWSQLLIAF